MFNWEWKHLMLKQLQKFWGNIFSKELGHTFSLVRDRISWLLSVKFMIRGSIYQLFYLFVANKDTPLMLNNKATHSLDAEFNSFTREGQVQQTKVGRNFNVKMRRMKVGWNFKTILGRMCLSQLSTVLKFFCK